MSRAVVAAQRPGVSAPSPAARLATSHWLWIPLTIFVITKAYGALLLSWGSGFQDETSRLTDLDPMSSYYVQTPMPSDPGILGVSTNWDGQWYRGIAENGYVPADRNSSTETGWAWAFPPLYPKAVWLLMQITGWGFPLAAVVISTLAGALAMVLMYRLAVPHVGRFSASAMVAMTCCFVTAPLYQVAYSESLGLLFVLWALLLIERQRLWWALVPVMLLNLTRLIAPPLALVALAGFLVRRVRREPLPTASPTALVAFMLCSIGGVFVWSNVADILGGGLGASRPGVQADVAPMGWFGFFFMASPATVILPLAFAATLVWIGWRNRSRWGVEMSVWATGYPLFVMTVTPATTGLLRYMMLAFPLGLLAAGRSSWPRWSRLALGATVAILFLSAQAWWVRYAFVYDITGGRLPIMP